VTSRILWLDGLDQQNANTRDRFVYIHGTRHEDKIGTAASHGCVRMRNEDVIELFEMVNEGTPVVIEA
jgi:lipoprotein-anchoring transpeptidase ErfK/SrfK